jgi:hypothetical protein
MKRLHEEIFEEPLSIERLFAIYEAVPHANSRDHEWVMDKRMLNRIRRLCGDGSTYVYFAPTPSGAAVHLVGLPVAIEPFAKLAIRERVTA